MTTELKKKSIKAIENKLAKATVESNGRYWNRCGAEFTFGNNRTATVYKNIPSKNNTTKRTSDIHYTISYLGNHDSNLHMRIDEVAEKLYELGLENVDPFKDGVNTKKLKDLGFEQIEILQEPNIKDIGFYLEDGFYQYKFEIDYTQRYLGHEYDTGNSPYYYGSTYQDVLRREYLLVRHGDEGEWKKVLYRYVKVGSRCVNNYVGD